MGFVKDKIYDLRIYKKASPSGEKEWIWVETIDGKLKCPYNNNDTLFDNWIIINTVENIYK